MQRLYAGMGRFGLACVATLCLVATAGASAPLPAAIKDADGGVAVKPAAIVFSGDGSQFIAGHSPSTGVIHWSRWTAAGAAGTGYFQRNNCDPSCANGRFTAYPVAMTLLAPKRSHGKLLFTELKLKFSGSVPSGYTRNDTLVAKYTAGLLYWE